MEDFVAGAGTNDVIEIDQGIFTDFAAVIAACQRVGSDVVHRGRFKFNHLADCSNQQASVFFDWS